MAGVSSLQRNIWIVISLAIGAFLVTTLQLHGGYFKFSTESKSDAPKAINATGTPLNKDGNNIDGDDFVGDATVVIISSLIPSHPSIDIINQTIHSLHLLSGLSYRSAPLIIAVDGPTKAFSQNDTQRWSSYTHRLQEVYGSWSNLQIVIASQHLHITGNIKQAMQLVNTKYVHIVQHDFAFAKIINHTAIVKTMEEHFDLVKIVRFNRRTNVAWANDIGPCFNEKSIVNKINNIRLTRTPGWSDNNHFTTKTYYEQVFQLFRDKYGSGEVSTFRRPTEWVMAGIAKRNCSHWGPFLYGGKFGGPFIQHLDGQQRYKKTKATLKNRTIVIKKGK